MAITFHGGAPHFSTFQELNIKRPLSQVPYWTAKLASYPKENKKPLNRGLSIIWHSAVHAKLYGSKISHQILANFEQSSKALGKAFDELLRLSLGWSR